MQKGYEELPAKAKATCLFAVREGLFSSEAAYCDEYFKPSSAIELERDAARKSLYAKIDKIVGRIDAILAERQPR